MKRHLTFTHNYSQSPLFWAVLLALLISVGAIASQTVGAQGSRYSFTIHNHSRYVVHHLYLSSSERRSWGRDQLGNQEIDPGEEFTLTNIVPGEYDVKFVDKSEHECVRRVKICENTNWELTTNWLAACGF